MPRQASDSLLRSFAAPSFRLFSILCCLLASHGSSRTPDQDRALLLNLKRHYGNPPPLAHWTPSGASYCAWPEIQCTNNGSVTGIVLSGLRITGTVPPFICELSGLRVVDLHDNRISGGFPRALYDCPELEHLDLSANSFTGPLPGDIDRQSRLQSLNLSFNSFSGNIPAAIGRLPLLQSLSLSVNLFNGTFPPEIGELSDLRVLEMADIKFAPSRIPATITRLKKLQYVFIARSNLVGSIPVEIGEIAALEYLDLSENRLAGRIPEGLFLLKNLSFLYLYKNNLCGEIPSPIRSFNLTDIDLGENNLTGPIPEELGKLEKLAYLSVYTNRFSGRIPDSIGRLPALTEVKLFKNNLSGPLPPDFGRYSSLRAFMVSDNGFTGALPEFLCAAGELIGVVAFNNNLAGELPSWLGNCRGLIVVMIYGNRFSGSIPPGLWVSPNLTTLMMSNNLLTGELPEKLALNLSRLELSNNRFSGSIPSGFPSQKNLMAFQASNNRFAGSIPEGLTALPKVETLLLDGNRLSGRLPSAVAAWESLTALNLSRNELAGGIPAEIGRLPRLLYLDLSENRLSGEIPQTLAYRRIVVLNLSSNDLSGRIPADLQTNEYQSSFLGNPSLCSNSASLKLKPCLHGRNRKSSRPSSGLVAIIFGITSAILAAGLLFSVLMIRAIRRRKTESNQSWKLTSFQKVNFTEADIYLNLTDSNLIGGGGSGEVYRAIVNRSGEQAIAIKKIRSSTKLDRKLEREFLAEVAILSMIRHVNIVKLLGCAYTDDSRFLIYEYMENHSLDLWLHKNRRDPLTTSSFVDHGGLDWPRRMKIAVGAAQGLCYMHHDRLPPIIHRDMKSSNILLDSEFNAKIADFGLARMLNQQGQKQHNTVSSVEGSFGYMAPECAQTMRVDEKIDVYGFGVVLLELATGREATDGDEHGSLVEWAGCHVRQGKPVPDALDAGIKEVQFMEEMTSAFKLGLLCTQAVPSTRPSMKEVLQVLLQCSQPISYKMNIFRGEHEGTPLIVSMAENNSDLSAIM